MLPVPSLRRLSFPVAAVIIAATAMFAAVALYDLGSFETSDEDLWKAVRIPQYRYALRHGLHTGDFTGTFVNDKPGATLAAAALPGLYGIPDPSGQDVSVRTDGVLQERTYRTENTEAINIGLRRPVVLLCAAMLTAILWLVYVLTGSLLATALAGTLLATAPVLVGMSRILNPDAVLWGPATGAVLAFAVALRRSGWRWPLLAGVLAGMAVAAKYTANLLLPFFLIMLLSAVAWEPSVWTRALRPLLARLAVASAVAAVVLTALLPAIITTPSLLAEATILSRGIRPILVPLLVLLALLAADAIVWRGGGTAWLVARLRPFRRSVLRLLAGALLLLVAAHAVNAWTGARFVPLSDLRETVEYQTGSKGNASVSLVFPMADGRAAPVALLQKLMVQSAATVFTLPLAGLVLLVAGLALLAWRGTTRYPAYTVLALVAPWVFFCGGLIADVWVNVRYGILLQPLLLVLAALLVTENIARLRNSWRRSAGVAVLLLALGGGLIALRGIAPFYLNYQNALLPRTMSFADSWSYGMVEAARWLNAQPDAADLTVWSDRQAFCQYFVGHCLRGPVLDLGYRVPDYFVLTRRNVILGRGFSWRDPSRAVHDAAYYRSAAVLAAPVWELAIGGYPLNYVKIVRSEEAARR